jgi:release factor glutamine methyltransferase
MLRDEVTWGAEELCRASVPDARTTASLLLAHVLGVDRVYVIAHPERELTPDEVTAYRSAIARRVAGVPFQQITGIQEFYGLEFEVTSDVLIPRPETEAIVEVADTLWAGPGRVLDVGTGSGCLAVTLALRLAGARVTAVDVSQAALEVARRNARRHGARVDFVRADLLAALSGPVDLVVANLPYVPDADIESLQREVRDYEPHSALSGGGDGLDLYRRLLADAPPVLAAGGHLVCEFGVGQAPELERIAVACGLRVAELRADLQGIPRTLVLSGGESGRR